MRLTRSRSAALLAGVLTGTGILHFARPKPFDKIVPRSLPGNPRTWTYASGVAEIGVAAVVAIPKTRRLGGLLATALFVAVFPANIKMAADLQRKQRPLPQRLIAFGRLPLQLPLITWALRVRREAGGSES